jgi:hypothetical protein
VQTFVTIWWLKSPKKFVAFISVGIQWTMSTLLVGIAYGVHTKPPREYYALRYQYAILTSFRNSMLIFYSVLVLDRSRFQKGSTHWRIWLVLADVICIHYPVLPSLLIGPWGHQTGQKLVCPNRARTRV